ncbi:hypothetical protein A3753_18500 [Sulfitobacter sp. HI0082]|nr:hypothetical protein A3753_18500 [Sulfitobacter sp. HI0082]
MRLGPGLLYEGRTLQGARPKLADFCSATMAEFYSAVDRQPWLRRVQRLLGVLSTEGSISGHVEREIAALHALLISNNANTRAYTKPTYSVDPASPVLEEISVLANELWQIFQAERATRLPSGANEGEGAHG